MGKAGNAARRGERHAAGAAERRRDRLSAGKAFGAEKPRLIDKRPAREALRRQEQIEPALGDSGEGARSAPKHGL